MKDSASLFRPLINKRFALFNLIIVTIFLLLFSKESSSMILGSLVLCSRFNGVLVLEDGSKVANTKIVRRWQWAWNDKSGEDSTTTNELGEFTFPEVTGSSFTARFLPHEPGIRTEIVAVTENGDITLFSVQKKNYKRDGELDNQPNLSGPDINLTCRLDMKPNADGPFWGTCRQSN